MQTVTLYADDFKTVHNTLCELRTLVERSTYSAVRTDDLHKIVRQFEQGLASAYAQDHEAFDRLHDHYHSVQQQLGLRSIWSIYEVKDLSAPHPYTAAREICYRDHWGAEPVYETINGDTWAALFVAADRCIQRSGDGHHVFIEAFYPVADQPHQLRLTTGS